MRKEGGLILKLMRMSADTRSGMYISSPSRVTLCFSHPNITFFCVCTTVHAANSCTITFVWCDLFTPNLFPPTLLNIYVSRSITPCLPVLDLWIVLLCSRLMWLSIWKSICTTDFTPLTRATSVQNKVVSFYSWLFILHVQANLLTPFAIVCLPTLFNLIMQGHLQICSSSRGWMARVRFWLLGSCWQRAMNPLQLGTSFWDGVLKQVLPFPLSPLLTSYVAGMLCYFIH